MAPGLPSGTNCQAVGASLAAAASASSNPRRSSSLSTASSKISLMTSATSRIGVATWYRRRVDMGSSERDGARQLLHPPD